MTEGTGVLGPQNEKDWTEGPETSERHSCPLRGTRSGHEWSEHSAKHWWLRSSPYNILAQLAGPRRQGVGLAPPFPCRRGFRGSDPPQGL